MSALPAGLAAALAEAGADRPLLVLDHDRMAANLAHLAAAPGGRAWRVADKSLAAPDLLAAALAGLATDRIMSFDLRLTGQVLTRFPQAQVLMGKPVPVSAAARFLRAQPGAARVTWLIDTPQRAADYAALGADLPVAFEVDIGLGRGGFADTAGLGRAARLPGLRPLGVMGYEAHVAALPRLLGGGAPMAARAAGRLAALAAAVPGAVLVNTGGSTTALALAPGGAATEITVGSAVVKPSDFDQPCNAALLPALFIATPVLKCVRHGLPAHPRLSAALRAARLIGGRIVFVHGGKWLAQPVAPAGLGLSPFYGASTNQQGFVLPRGAPVPDHVILRPTQSEAVIQQFPEILVLRGGRASAIWRPFPLA